MRSPTPLAALLPLCALLVAPTTAAQTFLEFFSDPSSVSVDHERLGVAVCGLGDVDGDGRREYAAAAARSPYSNPPTPGDPVIRVYSGATNEVLFALKPDTDYGDHLRLAYLGDLDGDGVGELLVGEPYAGDGQIEIFSLRTGEVLRTQMSLTSDALYGRAVANLGDIDGDGVDDYGVGAPKDGPHDNGAVYAFSGKFGNLIEKRIGPVSALGFGHAVAPAGDIHGDGFGELIVSGLGNGIQDPQVRVYTPTWAPYYRTHEAPAAQPDPAMYGQAVLGMGDAGADGVPDYAIGNPNGKYFDGSVLWATGLVHVHSGASGNELYTASDIWGKIGGKLGGSLARVADVDLDGVDELLVGGVDRKVLFSGADGTFLPTPEVSVLGPPLPLEDGFLPVASIGDLSGVGTQEFLVGTPHGDFPEQLGSARVFSYGETAIWAHHVPGTTARFGEVVLAVPDFDGDGVGEVLVGRRHEDTGEVDGGSVRAYSGATSAEIWTRHGSFGAQLGTCLALLDDLDGDGVREIAAGAPQSFVSAGLLGVSRRGKVEILSGATGAWIRDIKGTDDGERFGAAIASTLDVDGDGLGDLAVGAPSYYAIGLLLHGGRAAVHSSATGAQLKQWTGTFPKQRMGSSVAGPGDLDGDGAGDVVYLSPGTGTLSARSGATGTQIWTVSQSGSTLAAIGDITGDGLGDVALGAPGGYGLVYVYSGSDGAWLGTEIGLSSGEEFGTTVVGAGDVDLDGTPEFAVGAPDRNDLLPFIELDTGAVDLIFDTLATTRRRTWTGFYSGSRLGTGLSGGVDFNRDGIPDLVAGEPGLQNETGGAWTLSTRALGTEPFGTGTPGCGGGHLLVASDPPELGTTPVLRSNNGGGGAPAFLAIALGQDLAGTDIGLGFLIHVSLFTLVLNESTVADGAGTAGFATPIPPTATLAGLDLFTQVVHAGVPGACGLPLGLSSSEGLTLTLLP